ncbi:MAG: 50S ribosomal protein L17 [Chloroflexi bacterium]|nr:50S ribosomal protein L17 [Chloroflexota bacterium]
MRHGVAGRHLSRPTGQRLALYRVLVTDLLRHERVRTTVAKAKEVRALAEKIITYGKRGTLHHRRLALAFVTDEAVVEKVFGELKERYAMRPGGYTRVLKLGPREGDRAPMALLELVEESGPTGDAPPGREG